MAKHLRHITDLLIFGALVRFPRSLGWSRRASKTVFVAGAITAGLGLMPSKPSRFWTRLVSHRDELAGLFLLASQYQLTEEESAVRGATAVAGLCLILFGVAMNALQRHPATHQRSS